jgi:Amt family ammonium transporter
VLFKSLAMTVGLRVSDEEQMTGLDLAEHGANSYPDFVHAFESGGIGTSPADTMRPLPAPQARPAEASN